MQIKQEELRAISITLPPGRYSAIEKGGFLEIYLHGGDTEGCILLGTGRMKGGVTNSRVAMDDFMPRLKELMDKGDVWLQVS